MPVHECRSSHLFDHLKAGISLEDFLDEFPSVKKEQAMFLIDKRQQLNFL
ncbi:DUF433 domain-containing protein [Mucilaginibacter sp. KACC 22773]